jgi:hypothetical protein
MFVFFGAAVTTCSAKKRFSGKSIYFEVLLNAFYEAIGCLGLTGHA